MNALGLTIFFAVMGQLMCGSWAGGILWGWLITIVVICALILSLSGG